MRGRQKGFTLMELMVVIVIVAILAAVATPLYINYVNDAKRTEGKGGIGAVITAEQTFYQKAISGLPTYVNDGPVFTTLNVDVSDLAGKWTIVVSGATATSFLVTATGLGVNAGRIVTCLYTKGADPVWTEI